MNWRLWTLGVAAALLASACGRLGVGLPGCEIEVRNPTSANILSLQAVPDAEYAPCINSLQLGWDDINFMAESGKAGLEIGRDFSPFLRVHVTESCDLGDAVGVPSGAPDINRYEDIEKVVSDIRIRLIPTGERPLIHARTMINSMPEIRIDDRLVVFTLSDDIDFSVRTRVNEALFTDQYVWIINDLDVEENTLELRRTADGEGARGLSIDAALDRIEDQVPDVSYKGNWYLVFDGGCITYEFDASGAVAETMEQDAMDAFGLYPNEKLRQAARDLGYDIEAGSE
ncbi:MAG: hypothetical protein U9N84_15305 [Actinomycetota bacterium]|nr:hypothetical protein [Actinomycetota bacterium]